MPSPRLLDPTLDVVFQLLFGAERNRLLLLGLLTAVLKPEFPIISVELLPASPERQDVEDKDIVLDLRVRCANGEQVDVEMQNRGGPGELLTEDHELHVLELPKLEVMSSPNEEPADVLWGRFLTAKTDAEREQLAKQDPIFRRAKEALEELSADPQARLLAERRAAALRMHHVELAMTREEGEARGIELGEARGLELGEARGRAKVVCEELADRGIPLSEEQRERILGCTDLDLLRLWRKRAQVVNRAEQLFEEA